MLNTSATTAIVVRLVLALIARLLRAVDNGGALAGIAVGAAVALARGLPGLAVVGAFFVLGSVATRVGWSRKSRAGTAERGGGARGARRVLAKGGIAAVATLWPGAVGALAATGALAAALADTLGTEIGALARGRPRLLPTLRAVATGTPGAVSIQGTMAGIGGAAAVAAIASAGGLLAWDAAPWAALGGAAGALLESVLAGAVPAFARWPGTWRNVLTTGAGAAIAVGGATAAGVIA